jgi:hypothetical protein
VYAWHQGYWGPHVGFYGGVNYGFGYGGVGFAGGYWRGGVFAYNTSVSRVDVTVVHSTYNKTVVNNTSVSRVSYNGGTGGTAARPNAREESAAHENHIEPTSEQTKHETSAKSDRSQLASVNHGKPSVAATPKAGQFKGAGVASARNSEARSNRSATAAKNGSEGKDAHRGNSAHADAKGRPSNASSTAGHSAKQPQKSSSGGQSHASHQAGSKRENAAHAKRS